jgi:hypothetical protein
MKKIAFNYNKQLFDKANRFVDFRTKCKDYLKEGGIDFDKFTIVEHDAFIGYITEKLIAKYLSERYDFLVVSTWEDEYNIREIITILENKDFSDNSKILVKNYFYDNWDLKVKIGAKVLFCDVKTAYTKKEPNIKWNFLYPVIQANKKMKDIIILVYYIVEDLKSIESLKELILIGYTIPEIILSCEIIKAGEVTEFNTVSQIDNYITNLAKHYLDL